MADIIYGLASGNNRNIHQWEALTADGSTPAIEVDGRNFTFVDKIVGSNITVIHQGSLDGTDWFNLETHSHNASGIDAHFYQNYALRFVRATASSIGVGESFTGSVMVD